MYRAEGGQSWLPSRDRNADANRSGPEISEIATLGVPTNGLVPERIVLRLVTSLGFGLHLSYLTLMLYTYVEEKRARVRSRRGRACAQARTGRGVLYRT